MDAQEAEGIFTQRLREAIAATGVVDPDKAELMVTAVRGDFKLDLDGNELRLASRSGRPVEQELARTLETPAFQPFRSVPMTAGEKLVANGRAILAARPKPAPGMLGGRGTSHQLLGQILGGGRS